MFALKEKCIENFQIRFVIYGLTFWGATWLIIGLSAKDNFYSSFVAEYLNYPQKMRSALLVLSQFILEKLGFEAYFDGSEHLFDKNGGGVHVAYSCMGFGISSIWTAFSLSYSDITVKKKIIWAILGLSVFFSLNIARICILFVSTRKYFFGIEYHDIYNYIIHAILIVLALALILFSRITYDT